jgi:alkylation response protein AidB-like acyl-CoA dehydrogenase
VDGGWRLSGQKVWTSVADRADWGICLARTDPDAPKHKGITYFVVDMKSAGLDIRPLREITGEALFNEIFLDDVFVPDELVVGEVNGGWPLARTTLSHERVAMGGGSSIGDAVERLVAHCIETGSISDPVVATRLGALVGAGLAGSLLDLRTTLLRLDGHSDEAGSSVRKLIGVRHRQAVAEAALDLAGADGLVAGEPLHNFLMTRCLTIAGGTTQVLLTLAGERILGLPRG